MTKAYWESRFLDYLDGLLTKDQVNEFESALNSDSELRQSFEAYQNIMAIEQTLAQNSLEISPNFSVHTMALINESQVGFFQRLKMYIVNSNVLPKGVISALATLIVVIYLGKAQLGNNLREEIAVPSIANLDTEKVVPSSGSKPGVDYNDERQTESEVDKIGHDLRDMVGGAGLANDAPEHQVVGAQNGKFKQYAVGKASASTLRPDSEKTAQGALNQPKEIKDLGWSNQLKRAIEKKELQVSEYDGAGSVDELYVPAPMPMDRLATVTQSTEHYAQYVENEAILTTNEALSTFSLDVDTGSYSNVRRFLREGILPPADSVRTEEFINYFKFNYQAPVDKPFAVAYEIAPAPLDKDRYLLKIGVKAAQIRANDRGWNLVFLVDVSGSMSDQNKLPLVQKALKVAVQNMRAQDRIALVTYAGQAGLKLDSTPGSEKDKINSAIDSLSAGGSTNGSGGIELAYQIAQKNMISGGVNRVVLATDGDFNVGITSFEDLIKLIESKKRSGITLTTLGFGEGNYQEATMEQLADKGDGNYFYIDSFSEARKVLETDLVSNMQIVAKDVKAQIEFNPQHVKQYRLIGYDNRRLNKEDFNNDRIDAGEIGSGHSVTVLYELVLTGTDAAKNLEVEYRYKQHSDKTLESAPVNLSPELGFIKIRYKEPQDTESKLLTFPVAKDSVKAAPRMASDDFRFVAAVSYFGAVLRNSQFGKDYSLAEIVDLAQGALGPDLDGQRREFVGLVKDAMGITMPNSNQRGMDH